MERIISTIPDATRSPKPVNMLQSITSRPMEVAQEDTAFSPVNQDCYTLAIENQENQAPQTIGKHIRKMGLKVFAEYKIPRHSSHSTSSQPTNGMRSSLHTIVSESNHQHGHSRKYLRDQGPHRSPPYKKLCSHASSSQPIIEHKKKDDLVRDKVDRHSSHSTSSQPTNGAKTTIVSESNDQHGHSRKYLRDQGPHRSPLYKKLCSHASKIDSSQPITEHKKKDDLARDKVDRRSNHSASFHKIHRRHRRNDECYGKHIRKMGLKVFAEYKIPRHSSHSTSSQLTNGRRSSLHTIVSESNHQHGHSRKYLRDKGPHRSPPYKKLCSHASSSQPIIEHKKKDDLVRDKVDRHSSHSTGSQPTNGAKTTTVSESNNQHGHSRKYLRDQGLHRSPPYKKLCSHATKTDSSQPITEHKKKDDLARDKVDRHSSHSTASQPTNGAKTTTVSESKNHHGQSMKDLRDQGPNGEKIDSHQSSSEHKKKDDLVRDKVDRHSSHSTSSQPTNGAKTTTVSESNDQHGHSRKYLRDQGPHRSPPYKKLCSHATKTDSSQPITEHKKKDDLVRDKVDRRSNHSASFHKIHRGHCRNDECYDHLQRLDAPRQLDSRIMQHNGWTQLAQILTIVPELSVPCKQILNKLKVPQIVDWKDMERIISTIPDATRSPKPVNMLQSIKSRPMEVAQEDTAFSPVNQDCYTLAIENQENQAPQAIGINHTSNQIIKTNKRKQKFIHDSHEFYHVNDSSDGLLSFWRCSEHQKCSCQCRIHVKKATSQVVHMEVDHNDHTNESVTPPVQVSENQVENRSEVTNEIHVVKPNPKLHAMDRKETALIQANAIIEEFRDRCKKAKTSKDFAKLSVVYIDMAEHASSLPEGSSTAKSHYKKAILVAKKHGLHEKCYTAYRGLAELSLNCGNTNDAIAKIDESVHFAWQSGIPSKIQQARHYQAYVYSRNPNWLDKSLEIALQCLKYLEDNTDEINSDAENGGNTMCRTASLEMLLSEIYYKMGDTEKAMLYCEKCLVHVRNYKDTDRTRRFELIVCAWMMKSDLSSDRAHLEAAKEAARVAQKIPWKSTRNSCRVKSEVQLNLGIAHLRLNNIFESKSILWSLYTSSRKDLSEEDNETLSNCLVFIYKTERRLDKLAPLQEDNSRSTEAHKKTFEKIADAASVLGLHELAHHYYDKMLRFCLVDEDKRAALLSMAESANDFNDYQSSSILFKEVLALEEQLGCSEETLLQTKCMMSAVSAKNRSIELEQRKQLLEDTYKECTTSSHKNINLTLFCLENYLKFYADNPIWQEHELEVKILTDAQTKLKHELESYDQESSEENSNSPIQSDFMDEFDGLTDEQILSRFKIKMKVMEEEQKLLKQIDTKMNEKGETRLHFAARDGSYEYVYKLIENGYNINAEDNGGWTPLSEAVSAGHTSIVRLLLRNQAKPDCRSNVELLNKKGQIIAARGQTPLMEACANGNATIIQELIHHNANVTLMDDNEWTAADHLRYYMSSNKNIDNEDALKTLFGKIEERQRRVGFTPRKLPLTSPFVKVVSKNRGKASTKRKERRSSPLLLQSPPKLAIEWGNNNANGERTEVLSTKKRRILPTKTG